VSQTCEPHTAWVVEIVILRAIRPELASEHHLGDGEPSGRWGDETGEAKFGVLPDGAVEVGVEDAGEARVGP
jgi:hypothetical protein